jgi:hypothetical protein
MHVLTNPQHIQVLNEMAQFYRCFIKNFAFFTTPITKLNKKMEWFLWTLKCQVAWDLVKKKYKEVHLFLYLLIGI